MQECQFTNAWILYLNFTSFLNNAEFRSHFNTLCNTCISFKHFCSWPTGYLYCHKSKTYRSWSNFSPFNLQVFFTLSCTHLNLSFIKMYNKIRCYIKTTFYMLIIKSILLFTILHFFVTNNNLFLLCFNSHLDPAFSEMKNFVHLKCVAMSFMNVLTYESFSDFLLSNMTTRLMRTSTCV